MRASAGIEGHLKSSSASLHSSSDGGCLGVGFTGLESLSSTTSSSDRFSCTQEMKAVRGVVGRKVRKKKQYLTLLHV